VVNGKQITQGDFYRRILEQMGTGSLLAGVVTQQVVEDEARRKGITVTQTELDRRVDEILDSDAKQAGGRDKLEADYERVGLTVAGVRRDHERKARPELLLRKVVQSLRSVNDEKLRQYYQATYAQQRYSIRHVAYSFRPGPGQTEADAARLKLEARNKAARAADLIRKGEDFGAIARAESQDEVTAERGGELGAIPDDASVPEFLRQAFRLGVNEVSEPVENPYGGYHVFQVTAILPSESFVACKEKMAREIMEAEPSPEEMRAALLKLRDGADVRLAAEAQDLRNREPPAVTTGSEKKG
jgi:parvulin-like peptidyl-prolyl isomerase